jgi:hypothetical protein
MQSLSIVIGATFAVAATAEMMTFIEQKLDQTFKVTGIPSPLSSIEMIFQIKPKNFEELNYAALVGSSLSLDSNMGSINYLDGKYMSAMTPNPDAKNAVLSFLSSLGDEIVTTNVQEYLVNAYGPMPMWERALNCSFMLYENMDATISERRQLIRTEFYYLPNRVAASVLTVHNTVQFPYMPQLPLTPSRLANGTSQPGMFSASALAAEHHLNVMHTHSMGQEPRTVDGVAAGAVRVPDNIPISKTGILKVSTTNLDGTPVSTFFVKDGYMMSNPPFEQTGSVNRKEENGASGHANEQSIEQNQPKKQTLGVTSTTLSSWFASVFTWLDVWFGH